MIKTDQEKQTSLRHLKLKQLESGVLLVKFDSPQKANQLTSAVMSEFEEVLSQIENDESIKAVAFLSAKPDNFLLGADLREIMQLKSQESALSLVNRGQEIFARTAALKKPTIAGIHGTCLGGGLEVALCCHKRIATSSDVTVLGLPETKLGFVPGLGGTQRLPRLIGVKNALDLILSAESINVNRALEIKLIDKVVAEKDLEKEVENLACELIKANNHEPLDSIYEKQFAVLEKQDEAVLKTARRSMRIITKGNYPALLQVIDVIESGLKNGLKKGLDDEAKAFAELAVSDVSRNLVFLFFNAELIRQSALASTDKEHVHPIRTVGIIGGGMMGTSVAKYLAEKGFKVLFRSSNPGRTAEVFSIIKAELDKSLARRSESMGLDSYLNGQNDIVAVTDDKVFAQADMILEAIDENHESKVSLLKQLEKIIGQTCLFATITSSLSVTKIASELKPDNQIVGVHFFHPVEKMPLVEIVLPTADFISQNKSEQKYREANARVVHLIAELGKTPLPVKDSTCFLVNRLLASYLLEAARLAEAGIPLSWIDKVAIDFGMPMGPLTLLDEIGADVAISVAGALEKQFPERFALPAVLKQFASLGMKGKKVGYGVYLWEENGKRLGINPQLLERLNLSDSTESPDEATRNRISAALILPMIDEAAYCLEEKVVRRAREIDISCALGLGFPAFKGGILKYADSQGLANIVTKLKEVYEKGETKRVISHMLVELASNNGKFYA